MNSDYLSLRNAYFFKEEEQEKEIREDFTGVKPTGIRGREMSTSSIGGSFSPPPQGHNDNHHGNYDDRKYNYKYNYNHDRHNHRYFPYGGVGPYGIGYPYMGIGYQYNYPYSYQSEQPIYLPPPSNFTFFDILEYNLSTYPLNPTNKDIDGMIYFIYSLPSIIPCSMACKDYVKYFTNIFLKKYNNDIYQLCKDKTALIEFFREFKVDLDSKYGVEIRAKNYNV